MKKFLASFLSVLLLIVSAYTASATKNPDSLLQDFEGIDQSGISAVLKDHNGIAFITNEYANDGVQSLKLTSAGKDLTGFVAKNNYYTVDLLFSGAVKDGFSGFFIWLKNTTGSDLKTDIRTHSGDSMKSGAVYYLSESEGKTSAGSARVNADFYNRAATVIPKDFEGIMYIPFGSFNSAALNQLRICLNPCLLQSGALYIDSVGLYSGEIQIDDIQNFDNLNSTSLLSEIKDINGIATLSEEYSESGNKSLKLSSYGKDLSALTEKDYWTVDIYLKNAVIGDTAGIKVWLKNTTGSALKLDIRTNSGDSMKTKSIYYCEDFNKNISSAFYTFTNSDFYGRSDILLPADFEGWLYIPFDSFKTPTLNQLRICLSALSVQNGALYFDSISLFAQTPALNVLADFDSLDSSGFASTVKDKNGFTYLSTDYSESGDKSLKIYTSDEKSEGLDSNIYMSFDVALPKTDTSNFLGFKMWIKNTAENEVTFDFRTHAGDVMKSKSDYYLTDTDGVTKVYQANSNRDFYNRPSVKIPAGFEGYLSIPFISFSSSAPTNMRISFCPFEFLEKAVYIDTISLFDENDSAVFAGENFDSLTVETFGETVLENELFSLNTDKQYAGSGRQSLLAFDANKKGGILSGKIKLNSLDIERTGGICFWIYNTSDCDTEIGIDVTKGSQMRFLAGQPYYTEENGNVTAKSFEYSQVYKNAVLTVPAGFKGKVFLPFNSTDTLNGIAVTGIEFFVNGEYIEDNGFYIDNFKKYMKLPATPSEAVTENPTDLSDALLADFDGGNLKNVTVSGNLSVQLSDKYKNTGNYSIAVSAAGSNSADNGSVNIKVNAGRSTGEGIKFWIKTTGDTENQDVMLKPLVNIPATSSVKSNTCMYFESITGEAFEYAFFPDDKVLGDYACDIYLPIGFEGFAYIPYSVFVSNDKNVSVDTEKLATVSLHTHPSYWGDAEIYLDSFTTYKDGELPDGKVIYPIYDQAENNGAIIWETDDEIIFTDEDGEEEEPNTEQPETDSAPADTNVKKPKHKVVEKSSFSLVFTVIITVCSALAVAAATIIILYIKRKKRT